MPLLYLGSGFGGNHEDIHMGLITSLRDYVPDGIKVQLISFHSIDLT